jgi:hypothetical protein
LSAKPDATVLLVEGEKCADAAQEQLPELVCLTWSGGASSSNTANWLPLSGRKVIEWPDCDGHIDKKTGVLLPEHRQPGTKAVNQIAEILLSLGCKGWMMNIPAPGTKESGYDIANMIEEGLVGDALADFIRNNSRLLDSHEPKNKIPESDSMAEDVKPASETIPSFLLVSAPELTAHPKPIPWVIHGILKRGSTNLIFGDPGSGKSLIVLDWAFCVAAGLDWHGFSIQKAEVVIVAGEGFSGISRRLKALEMKYSIKAPPNLFISRQSANLLDHVNSLLVAESIKTTCTDPGLVIIDTLHRNMEGDENSSQDIGIFVNNVDMYLKQLGAAVLIVHHSGHGEKQRSRGSSSIRAAMDGEFGVVKADATVTLTCHKAKDFEPFHPSCFSLETATLDWVDDDGEPLTSVILKDTQYSPKSYILKKREKNVLQSLKEAIALHGEEPTKEMISKFAGEESPDSKNFKIVDADCWCELAYKVIDADGDMQADSIRKAFDRCRKKLIEIKKVFEYCGSYGVRIK